MRNFRESKPSDRGKRLVIPYLIAVLDQCSPHALLVPNARSVGARQRSVLGRRVISAVVREALNRGIAVHVVSSHAVKTAFVDPDGQPAQNRDAIHEAIVRRFPELMTMVPDPREKAWESERHYTPLFNTVAMYLAWQGQQTVIDER